MKPLHWAIISAFLITGAIVLYSLSNQKTSLPVPADIGTAPIVSETKKPDVPQLNSFSGLEEEANSLNQNSAPLKSGQ